MQLSNINTIKRPCTHGMQAPISHPASQKPSSRLLVVPAAKRGRKPSKPVDAENDTLEQAQTTGTARRGRPRKTADQEPGLTGAASFEEGDGDATSQRGSVSYGAFAGDDVVDEDSQERQDMYDLQMEAAFRTQGVPSTSAPTAAQEAEQEDVVIPPHLMPRSKREALRLLSELEWTMHWERQWKQKAIEDQAWAIHHRQSETAVNKFAPVRRLAAIMGDVEREDHESGNDTTMHWPSWARAELRFEPEWPAFNQMVADNIDQMIWKPPPGAEDDEEMDIMDDVLMLTDVVGPGEDGAEDDKSSASSASSGKQGQALDALLEGVLPGVTRDWARGSDFARDILGMDDEVDDTEDE